MVEAIHEEQLERHGGLLGIKDENALEASLARPLNKAAYENADIFELAASYLYGIVTSHPFSDGNKRTAFVAAGVFLLDNGFLIEAPKGEAYVFVMDIAAGKIVEEGATRWLRDRCVALTPPSDPSR